MAENLSTSAYPEVTPELIKEIKSSLGALGLPTTIYKVKVGNVNIVIRPLYRGTDWANFQKFVADNTASENSPTFRDALAYKVCQLGIVWPADLLNPLNWSLLTAGLQSTVSNKIFDVSHIYDSNPDKAPEAEIIGDLLSAVVPTTEELDALVAAYPQWTGLLRKVVLSNHTFVVRPVTRLEWRSLADKPQIELENKLVSIATIWPNNCDFESMAAGIVNVLSSVVFEACGFSNQPIVEEL